MLRFAIAFGALFVILAILLFSVYLGQIIGRRQIKSHPKHKLEILAVAESSVFALLALLIAFTFSGAFERFESRKMHLLTQANAFEKAMLYTDLVATKYQIQLRTDIVQYVNLHLDAYHDIPHMSKVADDLEKAQIVQQRIWQTAIQAIDTIKNDSIGEGFLQTITMLFEEVNTGIDLTKMHAPPIIFYLMLGLAALGGFMIGYDSAENKQNQRIHIASYIVLTAATIFVILNLEFPRIGFIHTGSFDQLILDVRDHTDKFSTMWGE